MASTPTPQLASAAFPSIASDPRAARVDPFGIPGLFPTKDLLLLRPDVIAPTDAFARSTAAYRTMDSGLLQSVAANGLRIDHDPTLGTNLGALIEESRTNLLTYTTDVGAGGWGVGTSASLQGLVTAPDGTLTARVVRMTSTGNAYVVQTFALAANTTYTFSGWARLVAGTPGNGGMLLVTYPGGSTQVPYTSLTGGWQRFTVTFTTGSSSGTGSLYPVHDMGSSGNVDVAVWGLQLEVASFATSFIPTTSAPATRGADNLSAPITSDWYNPAEGTFYADFYSNVPLSAVNAAMSVLMMADAAGNQFWVVIYPNTALVLYVVSSGQSVQTMQFGAYAGPGRYRIGVTFKGSAVSGTFNGNPVTSGTFSYAPATTFSAIYIGSSNAGNAYLDASIIRIAYIPRAQTAAVLQAMTATLPANLAPATPNRPGLMSPADKQALAQAVSDLNVVQQNSLFGFLLLAALRNVPTGNVDGIADAFNNTSDINAAKSSGYTFSAGAGTIGATQNPGAALQSTGNAIASSSLSGYPAANAFDGNSSTTWSSGETGTGISGVSHIGQDFGAGNAQAVATATITQSSNPAASIASAILRYADNPAGPWTNVATVALNGAAQASVSVPSGIGAHRCWDWLANGNLGGGSGWNVAEITMTGAPSTAAMVLQSATLPINAPITSPSAMRLLIQVDAASAAFAPNTDLIAKLSRDGGNTFTAGTLSLVQALPDGTTVYDTGWLSVAAQPAGNSTMTYLVTTPTGKAIVLTGAAMQVRP